MRGRFTSVPRKNHTYLGFVRYEKILTNSPAWNLNYLIYVLPENGQKVINGHEIWLSDY